MGTKLKHVKLAIEGSVPFLRIAGLVIPRPEENCRKNEETVEDAVKSIQEFGFTTPILVRKDTMEIVAGVTRTMAMRDHFHEEWIPGFLTTMDELKARLYRKADNKIGEGKWDYPKLTDWFVEMDALNVDLDLTFFDADEIKELIHGADEAGGSGDGNSGGEIGSQYTVVVECASEMQQEEVYDKLTRQGLKCRLMTV